MRPSIRQVIVLLPLLAAAFLGCGSLSNPTVAGGSGAGNPGGGNTGAVAVSISVHIVPLLAKAVAAADTGSLMRDTSRYVTTTDRGGTSITITSITLNYFDLHFALDSTRKPSALISGMKQNPYSLKADSNSIFLHWPRPFNALAADTNADSSISLPIAPYRGMTIAFQHLSGDESPQEWEHDTLKNNILMQGYFTYQKQVHNLTVRIAYAPRNYVQIYPFAGGMFSLSSSDTTHLELQFDAAKWFADVDFQDALNDNQLWLDHDRNLTIDNLSPYQSFSWTGGNIAADFLASGKLVVY